MLGGEAHHLGRVGHVVDLLEKLTQRALEAISQFRFPVHVLTKSDLVLRDIDVLQQISQVYTAVSFTITTATLSQKEKC